MNTLPWPFAHFKKSYAAAMSNTYTAAPQQIVPSGVLFQKPKGPQDKTLPTDRIFHLS